MVLETEAALPLSWPCSATAVVPALRRVLLLWVLFAAGCKVTSDSCFRSLGQALAPRFSCRKPTRLLGFYLCFLSLHCEHTWDPSISTRFCAFKPLVSTVGSFGHCFDFLLFGCHHRHDCTWTPAAVLLWLLSCCSGVYRDAAAEWLVTVLEDWPCVGCVRCILKTNWEPPNSCPGSTCLRLPLGVAGLLSRLTVEIKQTCMNKLSFSFVCT